MLKRLEVLVVVDLETLEELVGGRALALDALLFFRKDVVTDEIRVMGSEQCALLVVEGREESDERRVASLEEMEPIDDGLALPAGAADVQGDGCPEVSLSCSAAIAAPSRPAARHLERAAP